MAKILVACMVAAMLLAMQGCMGGEVTSKQQTDKAAALQKYADQHKGDGPPRQDRGSQ